MEFCHYLIMLFMSSMSLRGRKATEAIPSLFGDCFVATAWLLAMTLLMTSCTALDTLLATPTPVIPTETPLPSPTFAWFPPSSTPTPQVFITRAATPEMKPGLGGILLTDDLSDASLWDTAASDQASAQVNDHQINLAVQSQVYMISLHRDLVLNNFYAEITARPGLCRGEDSYGMLVRANAVAGYRFSLHCNGTVSAERVSVGKRQVLQAPLASGDAPPGAPAEVRIGVWAVGIEMRLFLNGRYQFSVADANYSTGTVGVFVNSVGSTAAVVSFTDLTVWDVIYIPPTRTPQP